MTAHKCVKEFFTSHHKFSVHSVDIHVELWIYSNNEQKISKQILYLGIQLEHFKDEGNHFLPLKALKKGILSHSDSFEDLQKIIYNAKRETERISLQCLKTKDSLLKISLRSVMCIFLTNSA